MNLFEKNGLHEMGIIDCDSVNKILIAETVSVFGGQSEVAFGVLCSVLDELFSKLERNAEGKCAGSKMFTTFMGSDDLTEKRNLLLNRVFVGLSPFWKYSAKIESGILTAGYK